MISDFTKNKLEQNKTSSCFVGIMGLKNRSKKGLQFAVCTQNFSKTFKSKKKREKNCP
jgi:hypothetical protein